jgi:hypothetical protein
MLIISAVLDAVAVQIGGYFAVPPSKAEHRV